MKYGVPYTFCWVESWASKLGEKYTGLLVRRARDEEKIQIT